MGTPRLVVRPDNPEFLELPWDTPILEWDIEELVEMPTGLHRHPVVFVSYPEGVFAIKELPVKIAQNEYEVLRLLEDRTHRAASAVGWVARPWLDPHSEQSGAVITRYVRHSFPYRRLVSGAGFGGRRDHMLDAVASLLVELHLAGLYWGDCSLSNLLYRWDAGLVESVMIDGETSSLYSELTSGQRAEDLAIMIENVAGEMADIAAQNEASLDDADLALGEDIARRYDVLWSELNGDLIVDPQETFLIRQRIHRLHELGYVVDDFELEPTGDRSLVKMKVSVGGRTFHANRLLQMTGIIASENQARVLLGDLSYYQAKQGAHTDAERTRATLEWMSKHVEPALERLRQRWPESDPVQRFVDYLHHRLEMASARGQDILNAEAFEAWMETGGPGIPEDAFRLNENDLAEA